MDLSMEVRRSEMKMRRPKAMHRRPKTTLKGLKS
jgi:hypothetical protein